MGIFAKFGAKVSKFGHEVLDPHKSFQFFSNLFDYEKCFMKLNNNKNSSRIKEEKKWSTCRVKVALLN